MKTEHKESRELSVEELAEIVKDLEVGTLVKTYADTCFSEIEKVSFEDISKHAYRIDVIEFGLIQSLNQHSKHESFFYGKYMRPIENEGLDFTKGTYGFDILRDNFWEVINRSDVPEDYIERSEDYICGKVEIVNIEN